MLNHLEDYIARHAAATPDRVAVDDHGTVYTYGQLWLMVQQEAARLRGNGYGSGRFVFFRTSQDVHFIVTYLAVHLIQAVAAPMGKDLPEAQLTELEARYHDTLLPTDSSGMAGIADVLFTTGTTGAQKGVMLSHKALLADADNLIAAQGFCADTVFVIAGPLNHIGSVSKMWPIWVVGGSLVLLDGMRDLDAFFRAFDRPVGKMATFLVPTAIGMCLRFGRDRLSQLAHRIDFIETGAAAIPQQCMDGLCAALPHSRLYNTYASTETGIVCTYDFAHGQHDPRCLGRPMRHAEVRIMPDGRIACRGDMLMSGYLDHDHTTEATLDDGWLVTEDLGELDAEGHLLFKGRRGEVINIGGFKVSPLEVEQAARTVQGLSDCVCLTANSPLLGHVLKLIYTTDDGQPLAKPQLARQLAARLERFKVPALYEHVDALHYTFNGKIDRKYYYHITDKQ